MLKSIKRMMRAAQPEAGALPGGERRQLQLAVAVLVHEARRADAQEAREESDAGEHALAELFGLDAAGARELLAHGREKAAHLTSFYAPLAVIKREYDMEQRIRLVEHLWRVSFADGALGLYEDHYVRKIAHLLYVPNTQCMLARNRARG
ncbi:MAG TPA: TerB family tellurite resistance protein [Burkholderiales bacterium]|nr:TerB family tellurite resistance protein [Burkholderiales bacterium]